MPKIEYNFVKTNGIELHVAASGPKDGKLVILLHGFPEFWYGWKNQIGMLAEAGYRVLVPDQRGYNVSDKPEKIKDYELSKLSADILGLIEAEGKESAVIMGHDWGGAVAWHLASQHPEIVEKVLTVNMPHPKAMSKILPLNPLQWVRSSYMFFFQLPAIPEAALKANSYGVLESSLTETSMPKTFSKEDLQFYYDAWSKSGALTAMLNWYRALLHHDFSKVKSIQIPARMIWGKGDAFLGQSLAKESIKHCENGQLIFVDEATHWILHEQPAIANRLILEFLEES
ncbi:alpha/beta fold hydrolase [Bacillus lacus]|uniref:Alpha/beta fold hydrolase n=1 Tax=Metabacillus lacus TaxID=1983721 RepID=A0A7X2IZ66_9BACI|nr:alpha/beta hydrolase [Metabacillus lacus]MRX72370.1 alpha/beta fold hydrolase [Metabacillus lacus]